MIIVRGSTETSWERHQIFFLNIPKLMTTTYSSKNKQKKNTQKKLTLPIYKADTECSCDRSGTRKRRGMYPDTHLSSIPHHPVFKIYLNSVLMAIRFYVDLFT